MNKQAIFDKLTEIGIYDPKFEHDNCGFGLITQIDDVASHDLVKRAITALERLTHRGAVSADGKSGDGCGLLCKMPTSFFQDVCQKSDINLSEQFATGMVFLDPEAKELPEAKAHFAIFAQEYNLDIAGWRQVPTADNELGAQALSNKPAIYQVFINLPNGVDIETLETQLYIVRRKVEKAMHASKHFYVVSLSARVIGYKALAIPESLAHFYLDLNDPAFTSSLCVFHQRFSTNTLPQWRLAQPFRYLAHNGEINTLRGNLNWALSREKQFNNEHIKPIDSILPLVSTTGSDSQSLDNMLEALVRLGNIPLYEAIRIMIPPAWQNMQHIDVNLRAFYQYHALHMEPWDGPAGVVMTDGRYAVCSLDRNGLRPARWLMTEDRHIIVASEMGIYDCPAEQVIAKGRVGAGEILVIDTEQHELLLSEDIDKLLMAENPYRNWLAEHFVVIKSNLDDQRFLASPINDDELDRYKKTFNVTNEEQQRVLNVLAKTGKEAIGSMGDDTPLAALSARIRPLYDFFRQQFAQVTNPPIDPLREKSVMSLESYFGREEDCFYDEETNIKSAMVSSPVLSVSKYRSLLSLNKKDFPNCCIDLNYSADTPWQDALHDIADKAVLAVQQGTVILILSDKNLREGFIPVHALLATGIVHQTLLRAGLRCQANIVVETGTVRDPHHFAVLLGFGATAIYPYLAYACIHHSFAKDDDSKTALFTIRKKFRLGINLGLYKILSKMGISCVASYRGAQLFEIIGLHQDIVDLCFPKTTSRLAGVDFATLQQEQVELCQQASNVAVPVAPGGRYQYRYNNEQHAFNPDVVTQLIKTAASGEQKDYDVYARLVNERSPMMLRDLLQLKKGTPIDIDKVESLESIIKRFDTAAMSLGALSPEAHEGLAVAMNQLGGRSNSGEGGEDPARYYTERNSKIKQVASGRFGVTAAYLMSADMLQIKIAQGAKPGEGGQLPGHKVNELIARLRFSRPGIALISPPPHHDIYSIEDLAQLIFDLKAINPKVTVAVKLVSAPGVGTIAAGVVKANADMLTISGYDGGTGASPLTSITYAGGPWELGLSETHQILLANELRDRITLQVDGGLKTGLDVIKGAILGAESFGFGTAPMIAEGCKYLRVCHLNNCATGVATQNEELRRKYFAGTPERVSNYFCLLAEEVRQWLALLGVEKLVDLIGRADLLTLLPGVNSKQQQLDLTPIVRGFELFQDRDQHCIALQDSVIDNSSLVETINEKVLPMLAAQDYQPASFTIQNIDRSIGAYLSGQIAERYGNKGLGDDVLKLDFTGTAGQSFGVWNVRGLHLNLRGEANDYVGKGMSGGRIILAPSVQCKLESQKMPIAGNACLYGATGGELYAAGRVGERFAVRNSGAITVVEGAGDHCCEYMTGGAVVVLGSTGYNFGAGMTGGLAYVLDMEREFFDQYNNESVLIDRIQAEVMEAYQDHLLKLLQTYVEETQSAWGQTILDDFSNMVSYFWLIRPIASRIDDLVESLHEPL